MLRFSLDTSCVLNLLNPDEVLDDALVKLLRLGLLRVVDLSVTDALPREVAAAQSGRRAEIAKRASILPVVELPASREKERNELAMSLFKKLWPNSPGTSKMSDHGRRDCEHLASHIISGASAFVTRDAKLLDKVRARAPHPGLIALSPAEAFGKAEASQPKPLLFATHSVGVRPATPADREAIESLLEPVRADYQDFDAWLRSTLNDARAVVNVGVVDRGSVEGIAIWKPKDHRTAKLSTFYLRPESRSLGLGQHLLFHCLRQWVEKRIERAYVTAAASKTDIVSFCLGFGFRIEGAAQRRYASGGTELVLTKHLMYRRVDDAELERWVTELGRSVFSINPPTESVTPKSWFIPPQNRTVSARWSDATGGVELASNDDVLRRMNIRELEELFYPVRLALRERHAYVIPIKPQWAERMMDMPRKQESLFQVADKLMLRIDNAYYCAPVYADDAVEGAPIVFYVSSPRSALTGIAKIIQRVIAEPEDLFVRFGQLGVYGLDDIRGHVTDRGESKGCAMAMHFGWWLPFEQPIGLTRLEEFGLNGHPQRMQRVTYSQFESIMQAGGIEW